MDMTQHALPLARDEDMTLHEFGELTRDCEMRWRMVRGRYLVTLTTPRPRPFRRLGWGSTLPEACCSVLRKAGRL